MLCTFYSKVMLPPHCCCCCPAGAAFCLRLPLSPSPSVIALVCLGIFWSIAAFMLRHRPWARRPQYFRRWLTQHVVMCVVVLLYFLYTTTTREIVSLFSCQQVRHRAGVHKGAGGMACSTVANDVKDRSWGIS